MKIWKNLIGKCNWKLYLEKHNSMKYVGIWINNEEIVLSFWFFGIGISRAYERY